MHEHDARKLARQLLLWLVSLGLSTTAYAQTIEWLLQQGQPENEATGVAFQDGKVCVAGEFKGGAVVGQTYVSCYDADGNELWTSRIYLFQYNLANGIAADSTGIYIAGTTGGGLPGQIPFGLADAFVRKYDAGGNVLWTDQFGTFKPVPNRFGDEALDSASGVAVDATGVYVVGYVGGTLPGQLSAGGTDAFIRKYDSLGNELWVRQFGTEILDVAYGVAAHESGVYVGGYTVGSFPGQTSAGGADAFLKKYDSGGNLLWTRQFGSDFDEGVLGISVNATGVFVVGYSQHSQPFPNQYTFRDNFVRNYDFEGNLLWAQQMDTLGQDEARGVFADETGAYVAGFFEADVFPEQPNAGATDAYVRKYDNAGTVLWTLAIGSSRSDEAAGVAVAPDGGVYVAGGTTGQMPIKTATGAASPKTLAKWGRAALFPESATFVAKVIPPPPAMPIVYNGGVVNNASYAPSSSGVAPGSIAAVFGTSLNDGASVLSAALGADGNLVTGLGDAIVTIDDIVAPMLYSTPGQLGIQIPFELSGQSTAALRVTVGDQTSAPETIFLSPVAPGIFTANQQGTGLAAALHQDGATVITPQDPAHPGEVIALFATGLGGLEPPLETGRPATGNQTVMQPTASIDGLPATVEFSGAAPGYVGLYQINIRIPEGARIAADIPVVLTIDGKPSNTVTIPVAQ